MKKIKAEIEIGSSRDGVFYYSVYANFNPESDERVLIVGGDISKDGSDIKENNKATEECLYKHVSELFEAVEFDTYVPTDIESRIRTMLHECSREKPEMDGYVAKITIKRKKDTTGPSIE